MGAARVIAIVSIAGCGRIAFDTTTRSDAPDDAGCSQAVVAVSAGYQHTCAVRRDGSAWCWGRNDFGQLGDDTMSNSRVPLVVSGLETGVTTIVAGLTHSCALKADQSLWCWGRGAVGALGDGSFMLRTAPVPVLALGNTVVDVAAGMDTTCAIKNDGSLWCWGRNDYGALGNGTTNSSGVPVNVTGMTSGVSRVATGYHTCASKTDGSLWCSGNNFDGALGDGTMMQRESPVQIWPPGTGVRHLTASPFHTCAIRQDESLWCWGYNNDGQIGDGTMNMNRYIPTQVTTVTSATAVTAATYHTCAIIDGGTVACWGWNRDGGLGDGTMMDRAVPTSVQTLARGATMVTAGGTFTTDAGPHTCAIDAVGGLWCWGVNDLGQIGNGTLTSALTPQPIITGC